MCPEPTATVPNSAKKWYLWNREKIVYSESEVQKNRKNPHRSFLKKNYNYYQKLTKDSSRISRR